MNFSEIKRLVRLVEQSALSELEVEEGGLRLRLVKHPRGNGYVPLVPTPEPRPMPPPSPATPAVQATLEPVTPAPAVRSNLIEVRSPMVGTFYRAPSPEAPPYVQVGDQVKPGQVLCIIEAMKLMNEIECEHAGRIVEIAVENAQPVEFNQLLFRIEPL